MPVDNPPRDRFPGRYILRRRVLLAVRPALANPRANRWGTKKKREWSGWKILGRYRTKAKALKARGDFALRGPDCEQEYAIILEGRQISKVSVGIRNKVHDLPEPR